MTVQLFAFKFYLVAPLLIALGFAASLLKRSGPFVLAGKLLLAIGFVFFGMQLMADASASLRSFPLADRLIRESFTSPWAGLTAGVVITVIIQSSAATLAVFMVMAESYVVSSGSPPGLANFLPVVLGANIGTCSTAFLAMLQAETEGFRVAWAHFIFKIAGAALALPFILVLSGPGTTVHWTPAVQIAFLHTAFNLYLSAVFLPLVPLVDRAIRRLVVSRNKTDQRFRIQFLHDKVLSFPVLALSQAVKEIARMSDIVVQMVEESLVLVMRYDFRTAGRIADRDDEVDFLHERIMTFLTQTAREELGPDEAARAYELIMVTTDIEHIGDIVSKRIAELAEKIDSSPSPLSQEGRQEIVEFFTASLGMLKEALAAFTMNDSALARRVFGRKEAVKEQFSSFVDRHMNRLYCRKAESLRTSPIHVDLLEEIDRINHFTFRIAAHILKIYKAE
jgi:phosphate:Na+ symporter